MHSFMSLCQLLYGTLHASFNVTQHAGFDVTLQTRISSHFAFWFMARHMLVWMSCSMQAYQGYRIRAFLLLLDGQAQTRHRSTATTPHLFLHQHAEENSHPDLREKTVTIKEDHRIWDSTCMIFFSFFFLIKMLFTNLTRQLLSVFRE